MNVDTIDVHTSVDRRRGVPPQSLWLAPLRQSGAFFVWQPGPGPRRNGRTTDHLSPGAISAWTPTAFNNNGGATAGLVDSYDTVVRRVPPMNHRQYSNTA